MLIELCSTDEVDEASMKKVVLEGRAPLAVYQVKGQFYVTDDTCTHGKSSLTEDGDLEDHCVTCGWHDGKFDIRTGEALCAPCTAPLRIYRTVVMDGTVHLEAD